MKGSLVQAFASGKVEREVFYIRSSVLAQLG